VGVRLRAIGAVAACSLALVACGGDKDGDTAPDAKGETASSSPDGDLGGLLSGEPDEEDRGDPAELIEALAGEPLVLDEGKGPRAQLALMPSSARSEVSTTMVMKAGGRRVTTATDVDMTITTESD